MANTSIMVWKRVYAAHFFSAQLHQITLLSPLMLMVSHYSDQVRDLVEEIERLRENGIQHNIDVIQVHIKAFICDAPAREKHNLPHWIPQL